ncbi:hypothetical protein [Kribbella sp. CA-294648]|uniref:hypothetical protein n=1 Tax=Kribbella sp. CA-294648 TaxID=3239948 RepID=UPI003D8C6823
MQITRSSIDTVKGRADWFTGDVYIFVTEGIGLCQRRGGPIEVIRPGDRVLFEPNEEHWHGATPTRLMTHLALNESDPTHPLVHWLAPVTDEEYNTPPTTT